MTFSDWWRESFGIRAPRKITRTVSGNYGPAVTIGRETVIWTKVTRNV